MNNLEKGPFGNREKRFTQAESNEFTEDLKEKMEKLTISFAEDENGDLIDEFCSRIQELSERIKKAHHDHGNYAVWHVLVGGSIPEGCKMIDFPEPDLSVKNFIKREYNTRFPDKDKQE